MAKKKIRRARRPIEPTAGKLVIALSMLRRKRGATVPQTRIGDRLADARRVDCDLQGPSARLRGREHEAENR